MRRPSAPAVTTFVAVAAVIVIVLWQVDPALLLANTATTGGDTGAHYGLAQYLQHHLLPSGHLTGWFPGAYDGLPLNTFYFPLPDTVAAVLGYVIPFNVAFKLMTILGSVTLPVAAWAFGRLAGLERPRPAVLAVATLPFLFDQSFTIYGGNLYSTMAGEYAFSLGLSFSLLFLGLVVRGLRTGRGRVPAALALSATVLSHLVPTLFAVIGALAILALVVPTRRRVWWLASVLGTTLLLTAWWALPFISEQAYSTTMGWQNVSTYAQLLAAHGNWWALTLALVGVVLASVRFCRPVLALAVPGVASAFYVWLAPQTALYNARVLPIWWLCVYLMAGYAVAELLVLAARGWQLLRDALGVAALPLPHAATVGPAAGTPAFATGGPPLLSPFALPVHASTDVSPRTGGTALRERVPPPPPHAADNGEASPGASHTGWTRDPETARPMSPFAPRRAAGVVAVPLIALAGAMLVVMPPLLITPGVPYQLGPVRVLSSNVPGWAQWNYAGVERKGGWPEMHDGIVTAMDKVSAQYGCGRAMWEYNSNLNRFGTPMALMLLPNYTNGCIDSMEGLLFESASSTPWHFINQAELSLGPSEAMVPSTTGIQYGGLNVALGVQHLQLLGVKYFMASSPVVQDQADADPSLQLVDTTGPWDTPYQSTTVVTTWKIYLVHDAPMVSALTERPDVITGVKASQASWLPQAQRWYANPAEWSQQLVAGGEPSWTKAPGGVAPAVHQALPAVKVTDITTTDDTVRFHVDRIGVPVLVAMSYFPAWHASGADGPWRAEPNLMVVVPTSHDVTLSYGSTRAGQIGLLCTVAGIVVLAVLIRRRTSSYI